MLVGGGLLRYFIGDNSPEAKASRKYIIDGIVPSEQAERPDDRERFRKVNRTPDHLYLIAQGFIPKNALDEEELYLDEEEQLPEPAYLSRHIILVRLEMQQGQYRIDDLLENAAAETVERILAYGIPEDEVL